MTGPGGANDAAFARLVAQAVRDVRPHRRGDGGRTWANVGLDQGVIRRSGRNEDEAAGDVRLAAMLEAVAFGRPVDVRERRALARARHAFALERTMRIDPLIAEGLRGLGVDAAAAALMVTLSDHDLELRHPWGVARLTVAGARNGVPTTVTGGVPIAPDVRLTTKVDTGVRYVTMPWSFPDSVSSRLPGEPLGRLVETTTLDPGTRIVGVERVRERTSDGGTRELTAVAIDTPWASVAWMEAAKAARRHQD